MVIESEYRKHSCLEPETSSILKLERKCRKMLIVARGEEGWVKGRVQGGLVRKMKGLRHYI